MYRIRATAAASGYQDKASIEMAVCERLPFWRTKNVKVKHGGERDRLEQ